MEAGDRSECSPSRGLYGNFEYGTPSAEINDADIALTLLNSALSPVPSCNPILIIWVTPRF